MSYQGWVLLALTVMLAACSDTRHEEVKDRLAGSWLQEFDNGGRKFRLVVTLEKGGAFQQAVKVVEADGSVRSETLEGDWFFDGETFKRRYKVVNGRRVSGIQFASYQFVSLTETDLVCVDDLAEGKRKVTFRRVSGDTVP